VAEYQKLDPPIQGKAFLRAVKTAERILKHGFDAKRGSNVGIIVQQDFATMLSIFTHAAKRVKINQTVEQFPRDFLIGRGEARQIPPAWVQLGRNVDCLIFISELSPETTGRRLQLLKRFTNEQWCPPIASLPGARGTDLSRVTFDVKEITKICLEVFGGLVSSHTCILITAQPDFPSHMCNLVIPFVGNSAPIISAGKITRGQWANCPSGETFILPNPYKAEGEVIIDGSLPGRLLNPGEWCKLSLTRGRILYPVEASSKQLSEFANGLFFQKGGRVKAKNTNTLAELGIGTNSGIKKLVGNPMFDEKKGGTVHLGIGSNSQFGGPLKSRVHNDLVCLRPTLITDRHVLIERGKLKVSRRAMQVNSFHSFISDNERLRIGNIPLTGKDPDSLRNSMLIELSKPGGIYAKYSPSLGQSVLMQIASPQTQKNILTILARLQASPDKSLLVKDMSLEKPGKAIKGAKRLISGLLAYGVLERS
jgi:hypothetical protein